MATTTYPNWQAGNRITAAQLNAGLELTVIKPTDQTLATNTTLQNDTSLVAALVASATYQFQCWLDYEGGTQGAADIKWVWSVPTGATVRYSANYLTTAGAVTWTTQAGSATLAAGSNGAGNIRGVFMSGSVIVSTTAGNMQLQWAQNTSNATSTIVHAQSTLLLQRVS